MTTRPPMPCNRRVVHSLLPFMNRSRNGLEMDPESPSLQAHFRIGKYFDNPRFRIKWRHGLNPGGKSGNPGDKPTRPLRERRPQQDRVIAEDASAQATCRQGPIRRASSAMQEPARLFLRRAASARLVSTLQLVSLSPRCCPEITECQEGVKGGGYLPLPDLLSLR